MTSHVYIRVTAQAIAMAAAVDAVDEPGSVRLARLFDAHQARLYRLARRMTSNVDDAQDLVQETFLRAARALGSVPSGPSAEEAWLVRVLINACRDGWRRKASRAQFVASQPAVERATHRDESESAFIAKTVIWRALQALSPRRRAAIVMYELEGTTIPEIAGVLGVSAVTVRWHLSRGRKELARAVAAFARPTGVPRGARGEIDHD
jgi:RNA polymerase sigma factor (sigma-70 family)